MMTAASLPASSMSTSFAVSAKVRVVRVPALSGSAMITSSLLSVSTHSLPKAARIAAGADWFEKVKFLPRGVRAVAS